MAIVLDGSNANTVGIPNLGTAQASTSGTAITFTGIPSGVKRITVMLNGVSTSGTSIPLLQVGAGSVTSSGYNAFTTATYTTNGNATSTQGFPLNTSANSSANDLYYGNIFLTLIGSNTWVINFVLGISAGGNTTAQGGGSIALSGSLDRVLITTTNGTDTFDAGSINIQYE